RTIWFCQTTAIYGSFVPAQFAVLASVVFPARTGTAAISQDRTYPSDPRSADGRRLVFHEVLRRAKQYPRSPLHRPTSSPGFSSHKNPGIWLQPTQDRTYNLDGVGLFSP